MDTRVSGLKSCWVWSVDFVGRRETYKIEKETDASASEEERRAPRGSDSEGETETPERASPAALWAAPRGNRGREEASRKKKATHAKEENERRVSSK
ncbi:UNVERIFIED_CONTAM: hypothetical protein HHA_452740 [Hammondia hammondi]|eukprot:XP_008885914.1 hypothetical protein HHA_452740 [Hammondia hammondi]